MVTIFWEVGTLRLGGYLEVTMEKAGHNNAMSSSGASRSN